MNTPRTPSTRSNIERLNAEGFEIDTDIPKEYAEVIEDLRPDEIELIIDVTRRLDLAQ
jgi:wyosine [tRNA(Phe)-imidazoG37] synthetase (radical SAM superfamily)